MKKWLILIVVVLGLLALSLVMAYHAVLSKNFLVAQIEASINSRVQVGEIGVSLFSVPATVVILDVIIAERDAAAREGVPHDERETPESGSIRVGEVRFDLSLRDLLAREINVSELKVVGAHTDLVKNKAGELNIEKLFAAPPKAEDDKDQKKDKDDGLNAKDSSGLVTQLDRVVIEDLSFTMMIEETGLEIVGKDVNLDFSEIRVDPDALEMVNEAQLEFSGWFEVFSHRDGRVKYGQIGLDGPARVRLFDPTSGSLYPDAEINFAIDEESYVSNCVPYVKKLWDLTDKLVKLGVKIDPLPDRLIFGRDQVLDARYAADRIDLRAPVSLMVDDWELVLDGESWAEFATEQHASGVRLIAGAKVSDWLRGHLDKVTGVAPESTREQLKQEILAEVFIDDRLTLRAATEGALSDPKIKLQTQLPETKQVIKDVIKTKALDFLRKTFEE